MPFIKTGYASPGLGEIFKIGQALTKPFHGLLYFAGEHTQMDFFGYMEGALRSGVRAAEDLIRKECKAAGGDGRTRVPRSPDTDRPRRADPQKNGF